ncbi:tetratricopeptide repeat protein [Algibacter sp. PT7-4]|uniref:tetratricopeptide repeat protein n=1 Tax=Algibacter ulvanivorans TaxID=3400999 RepID=UPI003AAF5042
MSNQNNKLIINKNGIQKIDVQTNVLNKLLDKSNDRIAKESLEKAKEYGWKIKDYDKAIENYEKALKLKPNYIEALNAYGLFHRIRTNNYNYAIQLYTRVIELDPRNFGVFHRRSACKEGLKDYNGAIEDALLHIENTKKPSADDYVSIALIKFRIDDFEGAIEHCTEAINVNAKSDFAYYIRGKAKFEISKFKNACEDFKKSIEIIIESNEKNSTNEKFGVGKLKYYGRAKFEMKEYKTALKLFKKLLLEFPNHHSTYELIANCYKKLNDDKNYKINIEKFTRLNEIHLKKMELASTKNRMKK